MTPGTTVGSQSFKTLAILWLSGFDQLKRTLWSLMDVFPTDRSHSVEKEINRFCSLSRIKVASHVLNIAGARLFFATDIAKAKAST
jgi:hypothetical protein